MVVTVGTSCTICDAINFNDRRPMQWDEILQSRVNENYRMNQGFCFRHV